MSWNLFRSRPAEGAATRMTPDEVIAVARTGAADQPFFARALANPRTRRTTTGVVWTVGSVTIDGGLEVDVDDGTGAVLAVRSVGPGR